MTAVYRCPHCRETLRQASRALDFFCGHCRMAVVIMDDQWAQIMHPGDLVRRLVPIGQCRYLVPATETGTGPLKNLA